MALLIHMIGVILATRGFVFTEVENAIDRNLEGVPHKIYRSFNLPIPDCQNYLVDQAIKDGCTYLWFVEEDVVVPDDAFERLMIANTGISCIDYGVNGWGCVTTNQEGEILWCGLGCTLVHKEVFDKLEKPYFRSDIELRLNDWKWVPSPKNKYGGQDIYFCMKAREVGFKITQVEGECRHLKLDSLGQIEVNNGLHIISDKPKISKFQIL